MRLFRYLIFCLVVAIYSTLTFAQLDSVWHQGPAAGSVASGVMVTLNPNTFQPESPSGQRIVDRNKIEPDFGEMIIETDESKLPPYVYTEDANVTSKPTGASGQTVLLNKFESISMTNSIPPDPHLAVGPNHIIATVNTRFAVYNKEGNELANISADIWTSPVISGGAFDPQIMYDHYEGRWFMLWDWQDNNSQQAYFVICYTDDDDPFGTWYMYLMDAKVNGTINSGTWGDYPQIGYDENAIFINSRSFSFGGSYLYNRIRILDKSQLYASNGGQVNYTDIWDIRTPGQGTGGQPLDVIHPVFSYTPGSGSYFFWANRGGANFYCVFQILNPLSTSPRIRGKVLSTQFYGQTPNANQLGGGTPLIETNGSHIKTQPVLRNGNIFFAHSIRNSTNATYASAFYGIYNISTETIIEQAEQGAVGYFYFYPTIAVDQDLNIAVTYSRSADDEYAGAFYTSKQASAPPGSGLEPSQPIQEGLGNYIVTFSGTRNRWGDYLGICVDPENFYNVFMLSEYARNTNQWGTYIAEIRMTPFTGIYTYSNPDSLEFGDVEVGTTSQNISIIIANYGDSDLDITSIPSSSNDFNLESSISLPYTLSSYDSLTLEFSFSPSDIGSVSEDYPLSTNDPNFTSIKMTGNGYIIYPAIDKEIYASSGTQNNGQILTIDETTGAGNIVGESLFDEITGITINPANNFIYGLVVSGSNADIVRVSALGDAYLLFNLDIPQMADIAFDTLGTLYGITTSGELYSIDLSNGTYNFVVDGVGSYSGIAFNPQTNELWATSRAFVLPNKDAVFKVNLSTGDTLIVGHTGLGKITNDIVFDNNGMLYGVIGASSEINDFVNIDINTGVGTIIGSTGYKHILGLAYFETGVTGVKEPNSDIIPNDYSLFQNFPNPFNPSTKIEFALPVQSDVQLNIYNILGQKVKTLFEGELQAGNHNFTWNADDVNGNKLSSGIYLYELKANGSNGSNFQNTKKMLLLK